MPVTTIGALVALDADVPEEAVRAVLAELPEVEVAAVVKGLEDSFNTIEDHRPDVLIVACQADSESALWYVREAARRHPERPVVVLSTTSPNCRSRSTTTTL